MEWIITLIAPVPVTGVVLAVMSWLWDSNKGEHSC